MKRRGVTILVGCVLLIALIIPIGQVGVSYVELGPGPTVDTLGTSDGHPIISVTGAEATVSEGELNLVTVSVRPELTLLEAIMGWWDGDTAVVPRELVYPADKTDEEVQEENAEDFEASQSSAETAALRALGYPVEVTVAELSEGFPAADVLAVDDVIVAVDGTEITSAQALATMIQEQPAGTEFDVEYLRDGQTATATIAAVADDEGTPRIGIVIEQRQSPPFTLDIELDEIGGPSAGLMFALGIIDLISAEDLTGGMIIVGTGTIDDDGNVGAIGGIQQKLVAARIAGAEVFLTPADNCADAAANAQPDLPLIRVATLDDALEALDTLRSGGTPALCGD